MMDLDNVSVAYGKHVALEGITLSIPSDFLLAIVGPNGGGKSTLLKAIVGIEKMTTGRLFFHTKNTQIAYLPQQAEIDKSFPISVYDAVAMGLWNQIGPFHAYPEEAPARIHQALIDVGMETHMHRPIGSLSGGQFQRILFARMSLQYANLILLDEPFNNLDQPTIEDLLTLIVKWHQSGKTILTVLHDLDIVKDHFPHSLLLAKHVVALGPTPAVLTVENLNRSYKLARQWGARAHG